MALLIDKNFSNRLLQCCMESSESILIFSAFVKTEPLVWLTKNVDCEIDVKVITRWNKRDLLFGASDLETYSVCKEAGWCFGVDSNLHGKLYLFDDTCILLGSANLTNRGLSLWSKGNIEIGVEISASNTDLTRVSELLGNVTWVDDNLFEMLSSEIHADPSKALPSHTDDWSHQIEKLINRPVEYIWMNDLLFSSPLEILDFDFEDQSKFHDFELLGLNIDEINAESLTKSFKRTRIFSWIRNQLMESNQMNFGAFTHALHNSLLDSPLPYRKKVKEMVAVLFAWFEFVDDEFTVKKHSYTSSVLLKKQQ